MKKFFKYFFLILLVITLSAGFIFRNRISLCINIVSKFSNAKESLATIDTVASYNDIKWMSDSDSEKVIYKSTNNKPLTLDIYKSKKESKKSSPVIIYVHGGSWVYGTDSIPQALSPILDIFREEGYTIISVSYEMSHNSIDFKKQISDVKDAIRWVYKNSNAYNLNTNEIGLMGISAGAHLSLIAAYSENDAFIDSPDLAEYPSRVKYLLDCFGPTDLSTLYPSNIDSNLAKVFNSIENKEELIKKYSPINYLKKGLPKTMIIHSKVDSLVPYSNSETLYTESKKLGNPVELVTLDYLGHDLSNFTTEDGKKIALNILKFVVFNSPL